MYKGSLKWAVSEYTVPTRTFILLSKSLFHHVWSMILTWTLINQRILWEDSKRAAFLIRSVGVSLSFVLLVIKDHYHRLKSSHRGSFSDPIWWLIRATMYKTKWQTSCLPLFTTGAGHFTVGSFEMFDFWLRCRKKLASFSSQRKMNKNPRL